MSNTYNHSHFYILHHMLHIMQYFPTIHCIPISSTLHLISTVFIATFKSFPPPNTATGIGEVNKIIHAPDTLHVGAGSFYIFFVPFCRVISLCCLFGDRVLPLIGLCPSLYGMRDDNKQKNTLIYKYHNTDIIPSASLPVALLLLFLFFE